MRAKFLQFSCCWLSDCVSVLAVIFDWCVFDRCAAVAGGSVRASFIERAPMSPADLTVSDLWVLTATSAGMATGRAALRRWGVLSVWHESRKPTELKDFTTKGMTLVESFEFRELVFDLFHSKMTWKATVEYEIRGVKLIYGAFG